MSSLVAEFLINPVLRQARRFSRPEAASGHVNPLTDQHIPYDSSRSHNGGAIFEADESIHMDLGQENRRATSEGTVSGEPVVSSPVEEDGGLERELEARRNNRSLTTPAAPATITPSSAVPRRLASFPPARIGVDDDATSANPSFGVPSRFDTSSPTSSSGSSIHNTRTGAQQSGSPLDVLSLPTSNGGSRKRNGSIPEDDGMSRLRRRIIEIQAMDISAAAKARMMHELLTEGYSHTHIQQHAKPLRDHSPSSLVSQDRPTTPVSSSFSFWQTTSSETPPESSPTNFLHTFQLSRDDLEPTYTPEEVIEASTSDSGENEETVKEPALGCRHYKRNVKLQCFTCSRWYTCRFCHDEVEQHVLNRKETRNMLCMLCKSAQKAGEVCVKCGARAAWYYCGVCHLWDDDTNKSIYHCNDCGICRVGRGIGKDFFHCKTCDVCIKISGESHKCIERASDCDCPICGEYLFSSPKSVCFMKCGHSIHRACFDDLMETSYKCPICSQSIVNMETQFRNLDRAIDSQPMPAQFRDTKAMVSCNDCYAKSLVKYHWLGVKCAICDSYNTAQLQIMTHADEDDNISTTTVPPLSTVAPPEVSSGSYLLPEPHNRVLPPSVARTRRHSSNALPLPILASSSRFTPYDVPERIGRSVSPMRGTGFFDSPMTGVDPIDSTGSDDEEDLAFWGGDAPRSPSLALKHDEEEDESDDSMSVDDDDDDEDGEEEDHMQLFGHR